MKSATPTLVPAEQSSGYGLTRFNALKHGILSRLTVLPWEDAAEYGNLLDSLVVEHQPDGPTQEHLVEEIAGIIWRKRRLRLAEAAAHHRGLKNATEPFRETAESALVLTGVPPEAPSISAALSTTSADIASDLADLGEDEAITRQAMGLLRAGKRDAYTAACKALREDTLEWWDEVTVQDSEETAEDAENYPPDSTGLLRFLETEVVPWYENQRRELESRPLIRTQAVGESLNPNRIEGLSRYEVHLDRKLERMLSMLLRLQELRRGTESGKTT